MTSAALKPSASSRTAVLHLTGDLEVTPQAREVVDLAIQTHRAGWRPLVLSEGGPLVVEAERAAVRHTALPLKTKSAFLSWRNRSRAERLIGRERPILIHAHGWETLVLGTRLSLRRGLPLLVDLNDPAPVNKARAAALRAAVGAGARFRVPSRFMIEHLRKDFSLETPFLYRVAGGVDLQWFDAARVTPERINTLYKLWRLPERATVAVMAAPFGEGSGHKTLLAALAEMTTSDLYAVLIGDDASTPGIRKAIENEVAALGLEGRVIMPETCADWPAACWLSSLVLAIGATPRGHAPELLAAQALGRPVVVSDCGAHTEWVKSGETAWVIPPNDKEALVAALREALAMSAARRIDLALRTRAFVEDFFPMDVWRDSLFEIYDAMLAQPMITRTAADIAA